MTICSLALAPAFTKVRMGGGLKRDLGWIRHRAPDNLHPRSERDGGDQHNARRRTISQADAPGKSSP